MGIRVAHITTIDMALRYLLLNQMRSIHAAGYDVVGISSAGPDVPIIEAAGIPHIAVPMSRNLTPWTDLLSLLRLYWTIKQGNFTIVHAHNAKPILIGQLAARMAGVPIVLETAHGFYFHDNMPAHWRRFYIIIETIAALCAEVILSQNREDIQTAIREGICKPDKITHLGNGIDIERFDRARLNTDALRLEREALGIAPDAPVVGFVGRLVEEKGILELFAAMQHVVRHVPNARLLIVGPIDQHKADALKPETAAQYGLQEVCVFTGLRHDMPEMYALMEASAMGVPCVATDIRGCREAVEHERNGLLVPLRDADALAAALLDLLTHSERAQRMAAAGRALAQERFDERLVFAKVKAEYARLLREKGLSQAATREDAHL